MQQLIEIIKEQNVANLTSVSERNIILVEKRFGTSEPIERSRRIMEGIISNTVPEEKIDNIMMKLDELGIVIDLTQQIPSGKAFADYGEIDNLLDDGRTRLKAKPGEVLLVLIWTLQSFQCDRVMQRCNDIMIKNKKTWSGKARILSISFDDSTDKLIERVQEREWQGFQHLTLTGWGHQLRYNFDINSFPFAILVDKQGIINFVGNPSMINIEESINQLIAQQEKGKNMLPAPAQINEAVPAPQLVDNYSALLTAAKINENLPNAGMYCFKGVIETIYWKGVVSRSADLQVFTVEEDQETIETIQKIYKLPGVNFKIHPIQTVQVPYPEETYCFQCQERLEFPYYWLRWEYYDDYFACRNCMEERSTVKGHHWVYEKNSVLLTGKWQRIPRKGMGDNLQPQNIEQSGLHSVRCNGCGGGFPHGQARYICLGCRSEPNFRGDYVDLCQTCMEKVIAKDEAMKKKLKNEDHADNHPLLRILYNTEGYYKF